jgi:hypothetical protein
MTNQYFIYGILVPYKRYVEWKTSKHYKISFIDDDAVDDIHGIFTGRDGEFIIIGKFLKSVDIEDKTPLVVPELDEIDRLVLENLIKDRFGFDGEFHYYFVTNNN